MEDCLVAMGRAVTFVSEDAPSVVFYRFQWLWDLGYWVFAGIVRRASSRSGCSRAWGARALMRLIDRVDPDVVVSVYPERHRGARSSEAERSTAAAGGRSDHRSRGDALLGESGGRTSISSRIPSRSRRCARSSVRTRWSHACTGSRFRSSATRPKSDDARRTSGLPRTGKVVLVSGGGWGVGDVDGRDRRRRSLLSRGVCGRLSLRPEREPSLDARGALRGRDRVSGRGVHRGDVGVDGRRRRARALDRRAHGARGAHARLSRDLVRLGTRASAASTTAPLSTFGLADVVERRSELRAGARARVRERAGCRARLRRPSVGGVVRARGGACGLISRHVAAAAAWFGPAAAPVVRPVAAAFRIPRKLPTGSDGVALTFDDGPHATALRPYSKLWTPRRAVATFFLVGEQVERHRRSRPRSLPPATRSASTAIATRCCCDARRGAVRDDLRARARRDRLRDRHGAVAVQAAVRSLQRPGTTPRPSTRMAAAPLVPVGTGLGGGHDTRGDRGPCDAWAR